MAPQAMLAHGGDLECALEDSLGHGRSPGYQRNRTSSEPKPGPMAARMLQVPGAGRARVMVISSTAKTEAEERLPMVRRASHDIAIVEASILTRSAWPEGFWGHRCVPPSSRYRPS